MQMPKEFQVGGAANYGFGFPTAEQLAAYDQQEADYYGITLDELRQFRQQQGGFAQPSQDQMNRLPPPCLLYTSPSPRDRTRSRMPSSA